MALELPTAVTQLQIAQLEGNPAHESAALIDGLLKDTPAPIRISKQREWKGATLQNDPFIVSLFHHGLELNRAIQR